MTISKKFDFEYTHKETKSPYLMLKRNINELERSLKIWMNSVGEHKITLDYSQSEYWPRLLSSIHGWIDWNWNSHELIQFIQAFGSPYGGARCLFADSEVILLEAEVIEKRTIHPFASGIILRCEGDDYLVIASRDGIMRIKCLGISEIKKSTIRPIDSEAIPLPQKELLPIIIPISEVKYKEFIGPTFKVPIKIPLLKIPKR